MLILDKNIVIYLHTVIKENDGGAVVQYYLASILDNLGLNVKICNVYDNNAKNNFYNNFITTAEINNMNMENIIVIYCEGIVGNPLNAKYVVRWMLSKLGQNVPYKTYLSWGNNELIYFFNSEIDIINQLLDVKYLTVMYVNPKMQNLNQTRNGGCFTFRKKVGNHIKMLHSTNDFEIKHHLLQDDYVNIFNTYEYFISYDPITFLSIIAALCGCISIICPIYGVSKKDYFKMTYLYEYMRHKNLDSFYGIAYGNSSEELEYAKNTKHLLKEQITDMTNWMIENYINSFINDLSNWDSNKNTVFNYIISAHKNIDCTFYREYYRDLHHMNDLELIIHYNEFGRNEGRVVSQQQLNEAIKSTEREDFDPIFYGSYYSELNHLHVLGLVHHYNEYGRNEGRIVSQQQL
jgi:hypothetical protein